MHITKSVLRSALTVVALLGLGATAVTAKPKPFHANFTDTWLSGLALGTTTGMPVFDQQGPLGIQLDIAATGCVSGLASPIVMLTNNHTIKFRPTAEFLPSVQPREVAPGAFVPAGAGTYTIRDGKGDSLVLYMDMEQQPVGADLILRFSGEWEVLTGTGRFAKATGGGTWTGWAKADDPATQASGAGGAELHGSIDLHETPAHHGRK